MSDSLHLRVEVDPILEEFNCPICYRLVKDCMMTACGHNFCQQCLFIWTSSKSTCPCCMQPIKKEQLVKNHHFDHIVETITEEKKKAEKKYFEDLIQSGNDSGEPSAGGQKAGKAEIRTVDTIFQVQLKRHVSNAKGIEQELTNQQRIILSKLEDERKSKIKLITEANPGADSGEKIKEVNSLYDQKMKEVEEHYNLSREMLLNGFDSALQDFNPEPLDMQFSVDFSIEARPNIRFQRVAVKGSFTKKDVFETLKRLLAEKDNHIEALSPHNLFVLRSPYDQQKEIVMMEDVATLSSLKIMPGFNIMLKGEVKLKSDIPKACLLETWKKGDKANYYQCVPCGIKWICTNCLTSCHSGHQTVLFLSQHTPNFACCYCPRRKCLISSKEKGIAASSSSVASSSSS